MQIELCRDGLWLRLSHEGSQGRMTLIQKSDDDVEVPLTDFQFDQGDLEEMTRGMTYQQVTADGHVCMQPTRDDIEISFRSRETGKSHGCAVPTPEFRDLLRRLWE
ncbi:MAG: hypothetical protein ACO1SV_04410 [Fimbriimonas sp.]